MGGLSSYVGSWVRETRSSGGTISKPGSQGGNPFDNPFVADPYLPGAVRLGPTHQTCNNPVNCKPLLALHFLVDHLK
jgi:hypothetical protein